MEIYDVRRIVLEEIHKCNAISIIDWVFIVLLSIIGALLFTPLLLYALNWWSNILHP